VSGGYTAKNTEPSQASCLMILAIQYIMQRENNDKRHSLPSILESKGEIGLDWL
jgi:hypothetical protein